MNIQKAQSLKCLRNVDVSIAEPRQSKRAVRRFKPVSESCSLARVFIFVPVD